MNKTFFDNIFSKFHKFFMQNVLKRMKQFSTFETKVIQGTWITLHTQFSECFESNRKPFNWKKIITQLNFGPYPSYRHADCRPQPLHKWQYFFHFIKFHFMFPGFYVYYLEIIWDVWIFCSDFDDNFFAHVSGDSKKKLENFCWQFFSRIFFSQFFF